MNSNYKFVVIGAGNLGTRMSIALDSVGHKALQNINRSEEKGKMLAEKLGAAFYHEVNIHKDADIVFIATNDDSIPGIISEISTFDGLIVHVSGSTPISVFESYVRNYGVFYPLQSFTADVEVDFKNIPLLIEASDPVNLAILNQTANSISENVFVMDSDTRLKCHLAAVIAANFSNHFIALGEAMLKEANLPKDIIHPLIDEMFLKIRKYGAYKAQTGPARRNDIVILEKHKEALKNKPGLQNLYTFVSDSIINSYRKPNSKDG